MPLPLRIRSANTPTVLAALLLAPLIPGTAPCAASESVHDAEHVAGRVRLILPPVVYATPGIETNVYFDNVVLTLNPDNYAFDVRCEKGLHLAERWAYTPSQSDVGEYPITIEVRDESNARVARGSSIVRVAAAKTLSDRPITVLMVGASFTEYSVYPQHVLDLSKADDEVTLRFIGSRGPGNMPPTGELRHEGYSGWTAEAFAARAGPLSRSGYHHRPGTGSPFVYTDPQGRTALDFARYCGEFNDGRPPDVVTIQVGTNDVFSATDQNIDAVIDRVFEHYDALIKAIASAGDRTRIGVLMVTPPSTSQDGFRNYRGTGKQTRWQFRRNLHRLMERMVSHFDRSDHPRVHLVPTYVNLDCAHHFPTWTSPRNARADESQIRVNNGTHPSEPGYEQIGDTIYAWIRSLPPPTR